MSPSSASDSPVDDRTFAAITGAFFTCVAVFLIMFAWCLIGISQRDARTERALPDQLEPLVAAIASGDKAALETAGTPAQQALETLGFASLREVWSGGRTTAIIEDFRATPCDVVRKEIAAHPSLLTEVDWTLNGVPMSAATQVADWDCHAGGTLRLAKKESTAPRPGH